MPNSDVSEQRYIGQCHCPGERVLDPENLIMIQRCAHCGGTAHSEAASVYQAGWLVEAMKADLRRMLGVIPAPGKAQVSICSDCGGPGCVRCDGTGRMLWRCCIQCDGMIITCLAHRTALPPGRPQGLGCAADHNLVCVKCRFVWAADDPRWLAQRLPDAA